MHFLSGLGKNIAGPILFVLIALCPVFSKASYFYTGVYLNPFVASKSYKVNEILNAAKKGLINTVIIDMKDDFGNLRFNSKNPIAQKVNAVKPLFNVREMLDSLHAYNIRVVARLVCFKDGKAAHYSNYGITDKEGGLWYDYGKMAWMDPYNKKVWDYLYSIMNELYEIGFDEIQLDYVRFPTDGALSRCRYPSWNGKKEEAIAGFLKYINTKREFPIQIDVFGYACWYVLKREGQDISKMTPYVDIVSPMLYPSHFAPQFQKYVDDNYRSYYIYFLSIKHGMSMASKSVKFIPYIQAFGWKAPLFGEDYIILQMMGALEAGAEGFFFWNAGGNYTVLFNALSSFSMGSKDSIGVRRTSFLRSQMDHTEYLERQSLYKSFPHNGIHTMLRKIVHSILQMKD